MSVPVVEELHHLFVLYKHKKKINYFQKNFWFFLGKKIMF